MFHKHKIRHHFCPECGISPFSEGANPVSGATMAAINARCLEGVDLSAHKLRQFDGRSL